MANLYGPMQFTPNPSGMTLNSRPVTPWTPPVPAAAPAPTMPNIMSFDDWRSQEGNSWRDFWRRPIHGDRGSRSTGAPLGMGLNRQRSAYDQYRLDALSGQTSPGMFGGGGAAPVQGPLALDSAAASYANFLNGRG